MEEWRDYPGYEGYYQASTEGRVRSVDRYVNYTNGKTKWKRFSGGQILKQSLDRDGYLQLVLCKDGVQKTFRVSTIVLSTFDGPRPKGMQCRHLNGNKRDNRTVNLKWGTCRENVMDAIAHGTHRSKNQQGEAHHNNKLTELQVLEIRRLRKESKITYAELSKKFKVCGEVIWGIVHRKYWKHV